MKVEADIRTDEELARAVQSGDAELFGVLVERYEQKLLRYGRKFLARGEDIEDIVQDAFVSAFRNIRGFDVSQRFSPWLYRIAHNAFVNKLRSNERIAFTLDFDALIAHQVYEDPAETERDIRDMRAFIDRGLEKMPAKYREVLVLHYLEDMPYKDIADVLQIPQGTVSIRLKRAKERLKKTMQHYEY